MRADYIVTDPRGARRAAIEIKGGTGTSAEWARQFRANLLEYSALPYADYFGIVTPEELYLWHQGVPPETKPLVVPIGAALERYLGDTGLDRHTLARQSLEMVIGAWLRDVIKGVATEGLPEDFITALRRGRLSSEEELDS